MTHKTTTSSTHWCDRCGEYFDLSRPGIILEARNCVVTRLCVDCLEAAVRDCKAVAQKELLKKGA